MALMITGAAAITTLVPSLPAQAAAATCRGITATIIGTPKSDVIHGTPGRDVIAGLGGNDTIYAGAGNDIVCGGDGADRLYGGRGQDTLAGGKDRLHRAAEDGLERVGDTLYGGPGDDRLFAGADNRKADIIAYDVFSWDGSGHGVHIDLRSGTARGEGADSFVGGTFTVVGSRHGDVVEGTDRRDRIETGAGPDVVRARGGNDIVVVDDTHRGTGGSADQVWGGGGADRITSGRGQDRLSGGPGSDWLEDFGASNDVLIGGSGDDRLAGQIWDAGEPQAFHGGRGFDTLALYSDRLNRNGDASSGVWNMASGAMTLTLDHEITLSVTHIDRAIFASPGTTWTVSGTTGDDFVGGSDSARMSFDGLAGDDTFRGSDGDDEFNGGPGHDHSLGMGDGDDTCTSVETFDVADCEHVS